MCKICLNTGCDEVDLCCDTGLYLTDPVRQCSTLIICLIRRGVEGRNGRQWPICSVHTPLLYHTPWLITQHGLATLGIFITSKILPLGVCYCVLCGAPLCTCMAFHICLRTIRVVAGGTFEAIYVWLQGKIITKESYFWAFSRMMMVIYHHRLKDRFVPFITLMPLTWLIELYFCCLFPFSSLLIHL